MVETLRANNVRCVNCPSPMSNNPTQLPQTIAVQCSVQSNQLTNSCIHELKTVHSSNLGVFEVKTYFQS